MLGAFHRVATFGVIVLGAVHVTFVRCYGELSPEAVWFAGAGFALVFLGLLNLAARATTTADVWRLCRVGNLLGVGFGAPAAVTVGEPHGYVGLLLLVALAITSWLWRSPREVGGGAFTRRGVAGMFAFLAILTSYQLVGCVADDHAWFEIASWALLLPAFAWTAWATVRARASSDSSAV